MGKQEKPDDLEDMRLSVHKALWRLRNGRPLSDDSCSVIERELEDIQKILCREDDRNE